MDCNCNSLTNKLQPRIKHVFGNVLSIAIPLTLRTLTKNGDEMIVSDVDFIPSSDYPVSVVFTRGKTRYPITAVMDGNVAVVEDKGKMPLGMYDICVECRDDEGDPYRFKQNTVLEVCDTTAEAGIDEEIEYEAKTWYLNAAVFLATTEVGEVGDVIDAKLVDVFGDADYDATAKAIRFYNKGKTAVLATIDARPFIADATVSDMYINTTTQTLYLVLDNEDGGRTFTVPLYLIFSNYYNKASVDNLLASKASSASVTALSERLTPVQVTFTRNTSGSTTTYTSDYTLAQINTNYSNHKPIVASLGSDVGVLLHSDTDYAVFEFADQYGEKYLLWCNHGTWNRIDGGGDIEIDDNPTEDSENAVSSGGVYAALSQKVAGISVNGGTTQFPTDGIVNLTVEGGGTGDVTGIKVGDDTYEPTGGVVDITDAIPDVSGKANSADLAAVATSGDYEDLANKPTIPAAQVQTDWNASSGMGVILNKPTLATVATSGAYSDLSGTPTIPTKVSDLTNDSGFTTNTGTLTGVTFNGTSATVSSGVAAITASIPTVGAIAENSTNAAQSGAVYTALAGKQDTLTFDDVPTAGSNKPVKSGGVKSYVDNKMQNVIINEISSLSGSIGISNADGTTYIMFGSSSSIETTVAPSISHSTPDANGTTVTITNNDDDTNAVIYYTTDGSTPTAESNVYSAPFTVNSAVTVKAIAYADGKMPSVVTSHSIEGSAQPTLSISNAATSSTITATGASGSTVYISTDGETWTSGGNGTGTASVTIQKTSSLQNVTVYAYATETGKLPSAQTSQEYNISVVVYNMLEGTCQNAAPFNVKIGTTVYPVTPTGDAAPYSWSVELDNVTSLQCGDGSTNNIFGNNSDTNILSITAIPSSVTVIGIRAFANMSALTSFTTGGCSATIQSHAFRNDTALADLTITDTCDIADGATEVFKSCNPTTLYLGAGITRIPNSAFYGRSNLTTLVIKAKNIGTNAFKSCRALSSLTLAEGVETIGDYAFSMGASGTYMSGFELVIPSSCKEIKQDAFEYCKNFASVEIKRYDTSDAENPITKLSLNAGTTSTGELGLSNTASFPIYVPDAALSTYQADQYWSVYTTRVKSINNKPS